MHRIVFILKLKKAKCCGSRLIILFLWNEALKPRPRPKRRPASQDTAIALMLSEEIPQPVAVGQVVLA